MSTMTLPDDSLTTPASRDSTLSLNLSEEKLIKRLRQLGSGLFFVIMLDNEPVITVVGGRVEVLKKLAS